MGPELTWGMPVILYLFLAGVGAGTVTVSGSVLLRGGGGGFGGGHFTLARYGALIGPIPVMLGTFLIVFELHPRSPIARHRRSGVVASRRFWSRLR